MKAVIFPGQGAQKRGMGATLFEKYRTHAEEASEILGFWIDRLCREGSDAELQDTRFTQPALYVVGALAWLDYAEKERVAFAAGHSLGELNALFAAGAFEFGEGLRLVRRRAELMAAARGGAMAAVVGLSEVEVRRLLAERRSALRVANLNAPTQVVIAGTREEVVAAEEYFVKNGAMYRVLNVSGAFHTPHMADAAARFAEHVEEAYFRPLQLSVISNVTACPYPSDVRSLLARQMTSEVRWVDSVQYMLNEGVDEFVELGASKVVTPLVAQIKRTRRAA